VIIIISQSVVPQKLPLCYTFLMKHDLETLRHSASHILAQAVKALYPGTKLGIGPAIEEGFYYDFDLATPISPEDLPKIEAKMKEIIKANQKFEREEMPKEQAIARLRELEEPYKIELVNDLPDNIVSFYKNEDFTDMCRGPHIRYTKELKAFKLLSVAGAYWKGSEKNKMLTRIYGTAFETKEELEKYLQLKEEAEKRDHRKLGRELDLFSFHQEAPANAFFHPKGVIVFNKLIDFAREQNTKRCYQEVMTPLILSEDLWHLSGHYDNYKDNMYFTKVDERDFAVKPMNCPGGLLIFKEKKYSYRDLPLRVGEFGRVHRHEKSGVTHGLFRVRTFVQDDAHIFCTEEQIEDEIVKVIDQVFFTYKAFGFKDFEVELSTEPDKAMGSKEIWRKAENALAAALKKAKINFKINEGDGAFYGPKIDFHIKDSLNRKWQCGTIQLDFSMPERFGLTYTGPDGAEHQPVMIHRAIYGSIERFMGILIEHFGGKFPLWLSPVQAKLLPVSEKFFVYAQAVKNELAEAGLRVEIDLSPEKLGYKIRQAQLQQVPYMLIVGEKEVAAKKVAVRSREKGDLGTVSLQDFRASCQKELSVV